MSNKVNIRSIWRNPIHFLAFGFGSGAVPVAPGTFGTLVAVPIYYWLMHFSQWQYLLIVLIMFVVGVWLCDKTSKDLGVHDHSGIVWDEIVGYLITMISAPIGVAWIIIGFLLFRLFDIWKPWPIRVADKKIPGGFGIMIDDVIAGIFAFTCIQVLAIIIQ